MVYSSSPEHVSEKDILASNSWAMQDGPGPFSHVLITFSKWICSLRTHENAGGDIIDYGTKQYNHLK